MREINGFDLVGKKVEVTIPKGRTFFKSIFTVKKYRPTWKSGKYLLVKNVGGRLIRRSVCRNDMRVIHENN